MAFNIPMPSMGFAAVKEGSDAANSMFKDLLEKQKLAQQQRNFLRPSGDVANALYVEQMARQFGPNDPRTLAAKQAYDMVQAGHQSLMDYRGTLNKSAGIRATSPLGKLLAEGQGHGAMDILGGNQVPSSQQNIRQPNAPVGSSATPPNAQYKVGEQYYNNEGEPVYDNNPRTPQERQAYEQAIGKGTTDAAIRNKIPYAKNVKITMDSINPEDLVQYSGPQGTLKFAVDSLKSAAGNPPPEFMEYQKAITGSKTLAKQLRQFWGDSIQPSATDEIKKLTNPSHWNKNPQVALQQFNQLKQITDQELQTFQTGGTSPVKLSYKDGNFLVSGTQKNAISDQVADTQTAQAVPSNSDKQSNDFLLAMAPALTKINPSYTPDNIKHTAKEMKMSVEDVVKQLMAKAGAR